MKLFSKNKLFSKFINFLQRGDKYLILVERKELFKLEKEKGIYLGSGSNLNKIRPALLIVSDDKDHLYLKLLFLTATRTGKISIELNHCPDKTKLCRSFPFYPRSFPFSERRLGYFCIKLKTFDLLEKVHYCGKCDNLEDLEKIPLVEL